MCLSPKKRPGPVPGSSTALGAAPQRWQVSGAGSSPTSCLCSPDILLGSPCQLCDEKWLCSRVCFPLNPSRKELVFSSSVLLKLALASCRIPASARASSPGKSCRDKLGVRAKWPKEHVQEQHSEQRCCSTPGKLCCWGEKSPKKAILGQPGGVQARHSCRVLQWALGAGEWV